MLQAIEALVFSKAPVLALFCNILLPMQLAHLQAVILASRLCYDIAIEYRESTLSQDIHFEHAASEEHCSFVSYPLLGLC